MALASQRLKYRKYHSNHDPTKRDAYGLPGIAVWFLSVGAFFISETAIAASLALLLPTCLLIFFVIDRARDNFPNFVRWATLTLALAVLLAWLALIAFVGIKSYTPGATYNWVTISINLVFLIVGVWFFLRIARFNLPRPMNKEVL